MQKGAVHVRYLVISRESLGYRRPDHLGGGAGRRRGSCIADAGAKATAHAAASTTPSAKVVAPAKKLNGVVLNVGDQAGTGAEAVLEAAGLINVTTACSRTACTSSGRTSRPVHRSCRRSPPARSTSVASVTRRRCSPTRPPRRSSSACSRPAHATRRCSCPKNSPITSVSQLAGKTIAVGTGTSADYHFLTVLEKAGLQPSQVTARQPVRRSRPRGAGGRRRRRLRHLVAVGRGRRGTRRPRHRHRQRPTAARTPTRSPLRPRSRARRRCWRSGTT